MDERAVAVADEFLVLVDVDSGAESGKVFSASVASRDAPSAVGLMCGYPWRGPPLLGGGRPRASWVVVDECGDCLTVGLGVRGDGGKLGVGGRSVGASVSDGGGGCASRLVGGLGLTFLAGIAVVQSPRMEAKWEGAVGGAVFDLVCFPDASGDVWGGASDGPDDIFR